MRKIAKVPIDRCSNSHCQNRAHEGAFCLVIDKMEGRELPLLMVFCAPCAEHYLDHCSDPPAYRYPCKED